MTALEFYTYALIEVNKLEAPSMLLEDYIYLLNKAVQQYINKSYNLYDINQQLTDNLRVLQTDIFLPALIPMPDIVMRHPVLLPLDYMHILNCTAEFIVTSPGKCESGGTKIVGCRKLTADQFPHVVSDHYFKPSQKNPYFFISNRSLTQTLPTDVILDMEIAAGIGNADKTGSNARRSNQSLIRMDIITGLNDT